MDDESSASSTLPSRSRRDEDDWVQQWSDSDDTDGLINAIDDALAARRPRLGARLVGLLPDRVEIEPGSPLDKARRAGAMLLMSATEIPMGALDDFVDNWQRSRRRKLRRITARQRARTGLRKPRGRGR